MRVQQDDSEAIGGNSEETLNAVRTGIPDFGNRRYRSPHRRFGKRRTAEQRAQHVGAAVLYMVWYAMCRLTKSKGRPVSLNQSAMAEYFAKKRQNGKRKRGHSNGPSRRTIIRAWPQFAAEMRKRGFKLVRVHSVGVGLNGKKRVGTKQRKLGWVCYSADWEAAGNDIYRFADQDADPAAGVKKQFRWVRNENGALLSDACDPAAQSTVSILPPIPLYSLSGSTEKIIKEQDSGGAESLFAGVPTLPGHPPPPKRPEWRIPSWALRTIWGICRQRLGRDAEPLAFRGIRLWQAGMGRLSLFTALERSADWGREVGSGSKGAIAAGFLAWLVMRLDGSPYKAPSAKHFNEWLECNALSMRGNTARKCIQYLSEKKKQFFQDAGIHDDDDLRRRIEESLGIRPQC